jgi:hypothetical protein
MMAVILLTDNDVYTVAEQAQTGVCPARRALAHLYSAAFFRCHPADHWPAGSRHSCPCHGDHSLLTRGGNRADDIGSGKLGTRSALEFAPKVECKMLCSRTEPTGVERHRWANRQVEMSGSE